MASTNGRSINLTNRAALVEKNPRPGPAPAPPPRRKKKKGAVWPWLLLFFAVLGVAVIFVVLRRTHAQSELQSQTQAMAVPTVLVTKPEPGSPDVHLVLPGTVQAYIQSTVYAQVTGYLKRWLVDIGTPVKQGQLLAEIETPALDQQLAAAQASQVQTQASVDLAQVTANRYNALLQSKAVSQQDVDQYNSQYTAAQANLDASKANVSQLQKTEAFKQVFAPFDGVLTSRRVDTGDLITSGNGAQQALFTIAQTNTLRVYVNVPEMYSEEMLPGVQAKLEMASSPGVPVTGTLVRNAQAIDPASLTLLVEVDVDNQGGKLLPGGYAQVHFDVRLPHPPLVLPGNCLIFRAQGTQVGVVDSDNVVHLKDIKIGRDFGTKIEVDGGIDAGDSVIVNPSDSLSDGQKVQVAPEAGPAPPKA
jgi:RND family efflux transporter MFP subunit